VLLTLFHDQPCSAIHFERFRSEKVLERLQTLSRQARSEGLESLDPRQDELIRLGMELNAGGGVTKSSLGVFDLAWQATEHPEWAAKIEREVETIRAGIRETHGVPLQFLIWAGMGGSAEDKSAYQALGLLKRGIRCYVLDSTDPAKLKYILEDITGRSKLPLAEALKRTLVVGMAMGMTSYEPVVNLEKLSLMFERQRVPGEANFLYMTLPGSLLDQFAGPRGYRRVELQPDERNSTAGRHSSPLTRGSLYPLGLAKRDLRTWIQGTSLSLEEIETAWLLAAFLHAQGEAGRDKVTLLLPGDWAGLGLWTKQNFEESLGKSEACGVKVVIGERPKLANYRAAADPKQDRLFLVVQVKGSPHPDSAKIPLLRRDGYPLAVLTLTKTAPASRYMQFMHYAVFGMAYLRQMNFVTQPSVELYKAITSKIHKEVKPGEGSIEQTSAWKAMESSPAQAKWRGGVVLHYGKLKEVLPVLPESQGVAAAELYAALLRPLVESGSVEYGELTFFGDTRYSPRGRAMRRLLDRAAEGVFRSALKMAVDVYEGPAMNHSYHEMIIGHGRCFSTVVVSLKGEKVAPVDYRADYHLAQYLATQEALAQRGRAVVAITVKDLSEGSLKALDEFFRQAARVLKARRRA
jgi:glucose-6-phosphate isomerase